MGKSELGNNIRRLRFEHGEMTQQKLADIEKGGLLLPGKSY